MAQHPSGLAERQRGMHRTQQCSCTALISARGAPGRRSTHQCSSASEAQHSSVLVECLQG
eukprot:5610495-Alexandrium_andersonii.AAC.1